MFSSYILAWQIREFLTIIGMIYQIKLIVLVFRLLDILERY